MYKCEEGLRRILAMSDPFVLNNTICLKLKCLHSVNESVTIDYVSPIIDIT